MRELTLAAPQRDPSPSTTIGAIVKESACNKDIGNGLKFGAWPNRTRAVAHLAPGMRQDLRPRVEDSDAIRAQCRHDE